MARFGTKDKSETADQVDPWVSEAADSIEADAAAQLDPSADYTPEGNPEPENLTEAPAEPVTPEVLNGATTATRRGRPKLADLPPVSADDLGDGSFVPEDQWEQNPITETKVKVRDEAQVKVDTLVGQVKAAWETAGKPGARTSPRARYEVKPDMAPGTRAMLTRAGVLHEVKVVPNSHNLPNGMVAIVFTVTDRPAPKSKKS